MTRYFICTALIFTTTLVGCHSNRDTDAMFAAEEREDAKKAEALLEKAIKEMQLNGLDFSGLNQVVRSVNQIKRLRSRSLSYKNVGDFQDQLESLLPGLEFLVNQIAHESKTITGFDSKYQKMGARLLSKINDITGDDYVVLRGKVETAIRNQNVRSPPDQALTAQAAARQLIAWGYSEIVMAPQGGLQNVKDLRDEFLVVRDAEATVYKSAAAQSASGIMAPSGLSSLIEFRGDIDEPNITKDEQGQRKAKFKGYLAIQLRGSLGSINVNPEVTAEAYEKLEEGIDSFDNYMKNKEKEIVKAGNIGVDRSKLDKITAELIERGLTQEQIQRLLNDTSHYVEVQQRMAELNYALEEFKDYAEVEAAGGIQAIVDRKVEQTKAASE